MVRSPFADAELMLDASTTCECKMRSRIPGPGSDDYVAYRPMGTVPPETIPPFAKGSSKENARSGLPDAMRPGLPDKGWESTPRGQANHRRGIAAPGALRRGRRRPEEYESFLMVFDIALGVGDPGSEALGSARGGLSPGCGPHPSSIPRGLVSVIQPRRQRPRQYRPRTESELLVLG
jgi:hypothetical protein